jgi:hypothetical protein
MTDNKYDQAMERIHYRRLKSTPPQATSEEIHRIEERIGHKFPSDYFHFLTKYGFTAGEPYVKLIAPIGPDLLTHEIAIGVFYGAGESVDFGILMQYLFSRDMLDVPSHLLPIASSDGDQICLSLAHEDFGKIYLWVQPSRQTGVVDEDILLIAESFDSFIHSLSRE